MDPDERRYYLERIAAEVVAAQRARHPAAAEKHKRLAQEYASLLVANDAGAKSNTASG